MSTTTTTTTTSATAAPRRTAPAEGLRPVLLALALWMIAATACSTDGGEPMALPVSTFPTTALADLRTGEPASLDRFLGSPVVVNLWATWCTPCRTEMPELEAAHQRYGGRVAFVGITEPIDQPASLATATSAGVTYPLLVDVDQRVQVGLGVTGLPATAFLDGAGQLLELRAGVVDTASLDETIGRLYGIT